MNKKHAQMALKGLKKACLKMTVEEVLNGGLFEIGMRTIYFKVPRLKGKRVRVSRKFIKEARAEGGDYWNWPDGGEGKGADWLIDVKLSDLEDAIEACENYGYQIIAIT